MRTLAILLAAMIAHRIAPITPIRSGARHAPTAADSATVSSRTSITEETITLRDLQLKEAEWVWSEMEDFVKLIQRYRGLFLTAVFAGIGWVLGQALEAIPPGTEASSNTLDALRRRPDIAAVLCILPILTSFFVVLILEASTTCRVSLGIGIC